MLMVVVVVVVVVEQQQMSLLMVTSVQTVMMLYHQQTLHQTSQEWALQVEEQMHQPLELVHLVVLGGSSQQLVQKVLPVPQMSQPQKMTVTLIVHVVVVVVVVVEVVVLLHQPKDALELSS